MKRPRLKLKAETIRELANLDGVSGGNTGPGGTLRLYLCNTKGCPQTNAGMSKVEDGCTTQSDA